jgi:hypothetical protein
MNPNDLQFEQGPIRPPNERKAAAALHAQLPVEPVPLCPVYKQRKFSLRTVEIKQDVLTAPHRG